MSEPLDKEIYQLIGEIKGYLSSIREDQKDIWKELATHRNEIFGTGTDSGIKGRLKSLELKIYIVGAVALGSLAASGVDLKTLLGGLF